MAYYEYKCQDCRKIIEVSCAMADKPETLDCPCGSVAMPIFSRTCFPHSAKRWRGMKEVNLEADDQHTQDQKQLAACVDDPKSKLPKTVKNRLLDIANKQLGAF